jgi:uncharacterized protein with NAD-binding domain and iron-sulfur cluster
MNSSPADGARPRVVILGGGMAGLVTAWELSQGDWRQQLDSITVYQRGWRLGGKGASSRGPHGRIEEHGLHVLLGCYDATFRVLREVYGELDRAVNDPACPIRTWREAFVPTGDVGLADWDGAAWSHFVTSFSANDALPGEPGAEDRLLTPLDVVSRGLRLLADFHGAISPPPAPDRVYLSASPTPRAPSANLGWLVRAGGLTAIAALVEVIERAARVSSDTRLEGRALESLAQVIQAWREDLRGPVRADPALRRTWQLVDLVTACLQGMVVDGLLSGQGYERIDHLDFRQWLARHGAAPETLNSPIVRGMHELTFAYEGGDHSRPRFAAGLGLQLAGRMLFDFKGAVFWRMQAGMGEVVFAPLYEALARRGVEFRFFRRLDRLRLSDDRSIAAIDVTRQADPAPGSSRYEPLVRFDGLPCWPDRPLADQLEADPGDRLESHGWSDGGRAGETLVAGHDFDVAVLAVSIGMVPHVASELLAANPAWHTMVDRVATVATQSAQLWLDATETELGWPGPAGVTLTGYGRTFATWASMSHLLPIESWPCDRRPRSLAYFCGVLRDTEATAGRAGVRQTLERFLERDVEVLWPRAMGTPGFRWELLWDDKGRTGSARLDAHYYRANVDPSDRYVQSLPGSGRYRLPPNGTGFDNLAIAGDWTACGFDAGCLEAATRSGVLAARAILAGSVGRRTRSEGAA